MIDYVCGILTDISVTQITVEAHGIGYEISIPLSTFEKLPAQGAEVKILTHFHVREDIQKLYGFLTRAERDLFRQLIAVSSIGPKTALSVLSKVPVHELVQAVASGDPSRLVKVPGVGAKTAERLVLELRGKIDVDVSAVKPGTRLKAAVKAGVGDEAAAALVSLGYSEKQVARAIERVKQSLDGQEAPVETWITRALQVI
ncbi:MAG: Holliday junction branch migration protein RuvA [Chitinispirillaceae bacterium]|jgi:Holliday junction DNA helicase RuvA|nr:Holliday junction branch migration protein RuvA [Chitinispirillaceae bacterium]